MFFKEEEINEDLICSKCANKFTDPRMLPCGQTYCHPCILDLVETNNKSEFKCPGCTATHKSVDSNGFPPNIVVAKLINKKSNEVYRGKRAEKLKKCLNSIHTKTLEFEQSKNSSVEVLKEYCFLLRNDVDLVTENLIQAIHNYREEFLKKIIDYEKECVSNMETNTARNEETEKFISEMKSFCTQWNNYLKDFKIDDDKIERVIELSTKNLTRIETNSSLWRGFTFNGNLMKFKENPTKIESGILGSFIFEKLPTTNPISDSYKKIDLKNVIKNCVNYKSVSVELLDSDQYFIGYLDNQSNLSAVLITQNGNVAKTNKSVLNGACSHYKISTFKNSIFVYSHHNQAGIYKNSLRILNDNLLTLCETVNLAGIIHFLASDHSNLYVISQTSSPFPAPLSSNANTITIYDHNLNLIRTLPFSSMPLFTPNIASITKIKARKNTIYFIESAHLVIMNLASGLLLKRFPVNGCSFGVCDDEISVLNESKQELIFYDLDGTKMIEKKLNFDKPIQVVLENWKKLSFFDLNNLILYFN